MKACTYCGSPDHDIWQCEAPELIETEAEDFDNTYGDENGNN